MSWRKIPVVSALHDGAATSLLLGSIGILALVDLGKWSQFRIWAHAMRRQKRKPVAYLSPYGWNHKVASVVTVTDETVESVSLFVPFFLLTKKRVGNGRESCLGDLDPWTVQILLQTTIELGQPTIFQVGDTLLLILDITPGSKFIGSHGDGLSCERSAIGERGERGFWIGRCLKGVRIRLGGAG